MRIQWQIALFGVSVLALSSCGNDGCKLQGLNVTPTSATASRLAATPGNQVGFGANGNYRGSCPAVANVAQCVDCLPGVTWSVSDPTNVSLAPAPSGISTIIATCVGQTNGAVTLTATAPGQKSGSTVRGAATFTCQ